MDLKNMITEERYKKMEWVLSQRTRFCSIVLENLYDPHNISAILRTAEAYGIQDIHVIDDQNPFKVSESVSMGSDRWLTIQHSHNTVHCLTQLKQQGYQIFTADPDPKHPTINEIAIDKPFVILMGQEKLGVSEEAMQMSDSSFRIPLFGFVESFNVSVACAIIISQLMYRLREESPKGFFLNLQEQESLLREWGTKNNFKKSTVRKYLQ